MTRWMTTMDSPIGKLQLHAKGDALTGIEFPTPRYPLTVAPDCREDAEPFRAAISQLLEYFAGERREFELAVAPEGTEFQQEVWAALQTIPYGETWSYGEMAQKIGRPKASRAVGAANGRNPVSIVIPCHRVIGSTGSLTGFGGGLDLKQRLLQLEGSLPIAADVSQSSLF